MIYKVTRRYKWHAIQANSNRIGRRMHL